MSEGLAALSVLAWLAYAASRLLARRKVPELVGFLVVGAALGPSGFGILDSSDLQQMQPATEIALAVLMFMIGERLSRRALRAARWAVSVGLLQYVLAGAAVYFGTRSAGAERSTALLLATLAGAGAPLTIAAVANSVKARGRYASGLISTHALKDALSATTFAAVLPVAVLLEDADAGIGDAISRFARLGVGGILLGVAFGFLISRFGYQIETSGELLLFVLVHILVGWTIADELEISLPLGALVAGAVAASLSPPDFAARLFRTVRTIEQPLYLLFFALAGASIHLEDVPDVGLIGVAYIGYRFAGQLVGGLTGGLAGGLGWRDSLRVGIDSFPQAGVAVGLAVLASEVLEGPGTEAATVVLGSVVIAELIGPLVVARGLAGKRRSVDEAEGPTARWLEGEPEVVLVATQEPLPLPDWLVESAGRWGARLVALLPGDEDAAHVEELRAQVGNHCEMETRRWVPGESFTGSVVRLQEEVDAHLVVLVARRPPTLTSSSRLVLLPHERIARQLRVPVLTMPYDGSDTGFEEAPPDAPRRSLLDRLRRRGADPLEPAGGEDAGATPDRPAPVAPAPVGPGTAADPIALQVGRGELTSDPPGGRPS